MTIQTLLDNGSIHPIKASPEEINRIMDIAHRDLTLAEEIITESQDWSFSIAYNAVLQACRAYMFYQGYRPSSAETHKITLDFMQYSVNESMKPTIEYFDRVRKKRHRTVYDEIGLISEKEARQVIQKAKEFISWIEISLKR